MSSRFPRRTSAFGSPTTLQRVALVALMGAAFGCADGAGPEEAPLSEWCRAACHWSASCDTARPANLEICHSACLGDHEARSYREQYHYAMATCLDAEAEAGCAGGTDASWQLCSEETRLQVPLASAAYKFCGALGPLLFECGFGGSPDACARQYSVYHDDTLRFMLACAKSSCSTYADCVDRVLEGAP